mgnify:CR=1 FL=1
MFICFILIAIYCWTFVTLFCLMRDIYSQHEYFQENLKIERTKLNQLKEAVFRLRDDAKRNLFNSQNCYECWFSLLQLDYNSIYSSMASQKQPIKTSFYEILSPLQKILIGLSLGNIHLIAMIYIKPNRLFAFSILLSVIHIFICMQLFLTDIPNVCYTLVIGIFLCLFSMVLLFRIIIDLLKITHYQNIKEVLLSKS